MLKEEILKGVQQLEKEDKKGQFRYIGLGYCFECDEDAVCEHIWAPYVEDGVVDLRKVVCRRHKDGKG